VWIAAPLQASAAAYTKRQASNRGKADVLLKDETRATLAEVVRKYYNARLRFNDLATVIDREKMGFTHPTPPRPSAYPDELPGSGKDRLEHPAPGDDPLPRPRNPAQGQAPRRARLRNPLVAA
jgi:hypothetical protein